MSRRGDKIQRQVEPGQRNSPGVPLGGCSSWRDKLMSHGTLQLLSSHLCKHLPSSRSELGVFPPAMPSLSQPSSPEQPGLSAELSLCDTSGALKLSQCGLRELSKSCSRPDRIWHLRVPPFAAWMYSGILRVLCVTVCVRWQTRAV